MTKKSIYAYIFNSSTLFNNVPIAQWSTHMPCNWEAAASNLTEAFGFSLKGPLYVVDDSGKKTYLAGLQCTLTSSCAINKLASFKTYLRYHFNFFVGFYSHIGRKNSEKFWLHRIFVETKTSWRLYMG